MNKKQIVIADIFADEEIIARITGGEKEFYAILIKKYNTRLYRIAMAIVNDDTEAEDAMQTTYIKAYENLGQFAFRSAFSTWLTRILVNECLLRKKMRKRISIVEENAFDKGSVYTEIAPVKTPSEKMINTELKDILDSSIRRLPEKYRMVFVMREIEGLSVAETQECLGLSEANVKVRLNRAKVLLKDTLSSFYKKDDILHFHLSRCNRMVSFVMRRLVNQ